jgi:hypothetical protein
MVVLTLCSWNALLAVLLGKDMNWDLLNYHFYNGYALLTGRLERDLAPAQVQTFFNPLMDIPLYLALVYLPPIVVGAVYGFVQGLSGVAVWLIGRETLPIADRGQRAWAALGLAFLGGLGTINVGELGGGMGDTLVCIPVLFSIAILLQLRPRLETGPIVVLMGWAALAGAISGVGAGLKITSSIFSAGMTVGCLFLVRGFGRRALIAASFAFAAIAAWLLASGFWLWRMWSHFGDPLFPFVRLFNSRPEFALLRTGGPGPRPVGSGVRTALLPLVWATDPLAVGGLDFHDGRLTILYLLLAALAIRSVVRQCSRGSRMRALPAGATAFLLVGGLCSYAFWLSTFPVYRYLAPLEWLAPLAITLALMSLLPVRHRTVAIGAVLLLTVVSTHLADWGRTGWTRTYFLEETPQLESGTSPMVVIAGLNALSFVVPYLPTNVRVVRLQSNSFLYGITLGGYYGDGGAPPNEFDKLVRNAIASHPGSLHVMFDGADASNKLSGAYELENVLRRAGLRLRPETCRPVRTVAVSPPPWAAVWRGFAQQQTMPGAVTLCSVTRGRHDATAYPADAAPIARLYLAYLNRAPDEATLGPWVARHKAGMSLAAIAEALANTPDFLALYGRLTDEQFVTRVYRNVLNRDPDPVGLAHWRGQLSGGRLKRHQVIWEIMQSPEYRQAS